MSGPEAPQRPDNAVEVQMPFIRHFFPNAQIAMMGIAASKEAIVIGESVGAICKNLGKDTVFIGSTDLTHYGPNYGYMPRGMGDEAVAWVRNENDKGFLEALEACQFEAAVEHAQENLSACCPGAAVAALSARQSFESPSPNQGPQIAQHYLSYDISPNSSFVGYGSLMF